MNYTRNKPAVTNLSSFFKSGLVIACLFLFPISISAQEQQRKTKVGIVLSGGGAKGMAHIGIIRALEENGIPIDYIAGTSAGAIIAGLYAAGYTTSEMEAIFISPEFNQWLIGSVQEQYIYYFKRALHTGNRFALKLNDGVNYFLVDDNGENATYFNLKEDR